MTERRRFHTAVQIFKSLHQSSPSYSYLHNIFHYSKDITGHVERNRVETSTDFLFPELVIIVVGKVFRETVFGTACPS